MNFYDLESEKMILASMIQDEYCLTESITSLTIEDFYDELHQTVFQIIINLYEKGIKPTYFELAKEATLGITELDRLSDITRLYVKGKNIHYWIDKVKELSKLRKFVHIMRKTSDDLKTKPSAGIIEKTEEEIFKLTQEDKIDDVMTGAEIAQSALEYIESIRKNKGKVNGLLTGIPKLDKKLWGFKPGNLILLGARTGEGKTALSFNITRAVAMAQQKPTLYLNTEMDNRQIEIRFASMLSGVPMDDVKAGQATEEQYQQIREKLDELYTSQLYFYNCPNLTLSKMISVCRKFKAQKNIEFAIIDYIGRMEKLGQGMEEWQMLEKIVQTSKKLAQNLKIPILGVVQLNEDLRLQAAKRMENEADIFLKFFPIEEELEGHHVPEPTHFIYIKKNRDGEANVKVPVHYNKEIQVVSACDKY